MSINSNFSYLFFLIDSGVNNFLQNSPNKHYKVTKNDDSLDRVSHANNIQNIESLNQLEKFIKTSNNCPLKNQASKTVFAEGRGICREFDSISISSISNPCTKALASIVNSFVYVGD